MKESNDQILLALSIIRHDVKISLHIVFLLFQVEHIYVHDGGMISSPPSPLIKFRSLNIKKIKQILYVFWSDT